MAARAHTRARTPELVRAILFINAVAREPCQPQPFWQRHLLVLFSAVSMIQIDNLVTIFPPAVLRFVVHLCICSQWGNENRIISVLFSMAHYFRTSSWCHHSPLLHFWVTFFLRLFTSLRAFIRNAGSEDFCIAVAMVCYLLLSIAFGPFTVAPSYIKTYTDALRSCALSH